MNRRKMTLNEEINQMKKLFGHMNMPLLIRESVGNPVKGGALVALDSGSSIARYVGVGVSKEIEDAIVLASKNSDAITKSLGKQINSFADLEVAYPGLSRSEVAMSVISSMEKQTAKDLVFNISSQLAPVNLYNLKINLTKLTAPEVQSLKTSLSNLESGSLKQLLDPATAEAAAEILPVTINKIKGIINGISDSSMPAATKQSLLDTLDGIEAQASTVMIKTGANEVMDSDISKFFPDNPEIVTLYKKSTTTQRKIAEDAVQGLDSEQQIALLTKLKSDYDSGSLRGYSESRLEPYDVEKWVKMIPNILKEWSKKGTSAPGGCFNMFLVIGLVMFGIPGLLFLKSCEPDKIKVPDINPFNDNKEVTCCSEVVGYSKLNEDQQKYVVLTFGCTRTKDDTSDNKVIAFGTDSSGNLVVRYKKVCTETYTVQTGGLIAKLVGSPCDSNTTTKKYACVNNNCVENTTGTFTDPACDGTCGYTNNEAGFNKWVNDNGYSNPGYSGRWYTDNGTDKQATYSDGTWKINKF